MLVSARLVVSIPVFIRRSTMLCHCHSSRSSLRMQVLVRRGLDSRLNLWLHILWLSCRSRSNRLGLSRPRTILRLEIIWWTSNRLGGRRLGVIWWTSNRLSCRRLGVIWRTSNRLCGRRPDVIWRTSNRLDGRRLGVIWRTSNRLGCRRLSVIWRTNRLGDRLNWLTRSWELIFGVKRLNRRYRIS